jgi:hypothetical protein
MAEHTKLRRVVAFVATIGTLLGAGIWTQLSSAGAAGQDKIQYNQQTGSSGTYILYVPGDGSKTTKQSVTSGGGCATPTPSGTPILAFGARFYPSGYLGSSSAAVVGAYKSRTGVCSIPQSWSIEVNEALRFSVGANSLVAGRLFSRAQLQLEREDKSSAGSAPVTGQLVEFLNGTQVGTQNFSIAAPDGTQITADTGVSANAFDTVEIRVTSPAAGSISVVGPTSTFTLANQICVTETINTSSTDGTATSGQVSASITYAGNTVDSTRCKPYTSFTATTTDANSSNGKAIEFLSSQVAGAHLTTHFDWGYFPYCRPDAAVAGVPTCPTTYIDFGSGENPQVYCAAANPPTTPAWCTTKRTFDYVTIGGVQYTHITEDWDGLGDVIYRFH